jgi:hypothetical protein
MGNEFTNSSEDRDFHHGGDVVMLSEPRNPRRIDYLAKIRSVIQSRNEGHHLWGWKDPISILYVPDILHLLRNTHFVVVTRDLGAVAQRESFEGTAARGSIAFAMLQAAELYAQISRLIIRAQLPTIMLSYERTLSMPRQAAAALEAFTGLEAPDFESWAGDFVRKS